MKKHGFSARDIIIFCVLSALVCLLAFALSRVSGIDAPANPGIAITEVMADNEAAWFGGGAYCDWVEIANLSGETMNLTGWKLACGADTRKAYDMGIRTLLPGARAVVYCASGTAVDFDIPRSGAYLSILAPNGRTVTSVTTPAMAAGESWARAEDGGEWMHTDAYTPGLPNTPESHQALLYPDVSDAPVVVSELMAKNKSTITDPAGGYSDWLELLNTTGQSLDLTGWSLTDDPANRVRQRLDGITLAPGECALVWLTGAKGSGLGLSASGETVWLINPEGQIAYWLTYNRLGRDESFSRAADGSYTTALPPTPGYANSISGMRSARTGGYVPLSQNAYGVYINEVCAAYTGYYDWVELYNATAHDIDLSGWGVSDDPSRPRRWRFPEGAVIPAGGYVVVCLVNDGAQNANTAGVYYASGFALSFDGGETVALSDADGNLVDSLAVTGVALDVSLGRADGHDTYRYFNAPTPGKPNAAASYAKRAAEVAFSVDGGMMGDAPITLTLSSDPGATIYYTLDGSVPGQNSYVYTSPITLSSTTVVRAMAVCPDMLDSLISARTYVFGEKTNLRVIAVSGDKDMLSGNSGVLNTGAKTDVIVSAEIYDYDGALLIDQVCRLRMSGQSSRTNMSQKAFTLTAKRAYGAANFDGALFTKRDRTSYDSIVLRASGQDVFQTHMRDSILTSLAEGTGLLYQETELAVVYVNGEYWGVYNMRERVNLASIAAFEGAGSTENIDFLEGDSTKSTRAGSRKTYDTIMKLVIERGLGTDALVEELSRYVDIDNYLDYVAFQMYTANLDLNNLRAYRVGGASGRWKWVLYDLDLSFQVDKNTPRMWLKDDRAGTITTQDNALFRELMKNPAMRDKFLARMGELLADNLSSQTVVGKIRARYITLSEDMQAQCARWGTSTTTWHRYVMNMVEYAEARPVKLISYIKDAFELTDEEVSRYFSEALAAAEEYVRPTGQ